MLSAELIQHLKEVVEIMSQVDFQESQTTKTMREMVKLISAKLGMDLWKNLGHQGHAVDAYWQLARSNEDIECMVNARRNERLCEMLAS